MRDSLRLRLAGSSGGESPNLVERWIGFVGKWKPVGSEYEIQDCAGRETLGRIQEEKRHE